MPQMDMLAKLAMVSVIGLLVGFIVLYHAWMDRRSGRRPAPESTKAPTPPAVPDAAPHPQARASR